MSATLSVIPAKAGIQKGMSPCPSLFPQRHDAFL